jgi:hypothetical protein
MTAKEHDGRAQHHQPEEQDVEGDVEEEGAKKQHAA